MKKQLISLVLSLGMITSATASMIEYDFTGGSGNYSSIDFTVDGVTTTATATYNGFTNIADVSRDSHRRGSGHGLGVKNHIFDSGDIDGFLRDDYLTLTFDFTVNLLGLDFGHDSSNDEFDLYVDNVNVANNLETTGGWTTFALGAYSGTSFTVRASQFNDNFLLSGMRINAVPEPATLVLMSFGLLGMGVVVRRRRS